MGSLVLIYLGKRVKLLDRDNTDNQPIRNSGFLVKILLKNKIYI